jgi:hypothetical protein
MAVTPETVDEVFFCDLNEKLTRLYEIATEYVF